MPLSRRSVFARYSPLANDSTGAQRDDCSASLSVRERGDLTTSLAVALPPKQSLTPHQNEWPLFGTEFGRPTDQNWPGAAVRKRPKAVVAIAECTSLLGMLCAMCSSVSTMPTSEHQACEITQVPHGGMQKQRVDRAPKSAGETLTTPRQRTGRWFRCSIGSRPNARLLNTGSLPRWLLDCAAGSP